MAMEDGVLLGSFQAAELFVKPYASYTFSGEATHASGEARYDWAVQRREAGERQWFHTSQRDVQVAYGYEYDTVPVLTVMDDVATSTFMMHGYEMLGDSALRVDAARINSMPSTELVWGETYLKSSKNFSYGGLNGNLPSPMTYSDGATPHGTNAAGWWYGKNGAGIDGMGQAFENPEHPYLLTGVVLMTAFLDVTQPTAMRCTVYRLDSVPDYDGTASVTLDAVLGDVITTGTATVTSATHSSTGGLVVFSLADTPTIDSAILVAVEGYNDEDAAGIADFSALISADIHVDEGHGELAYLKQDGQWHGLNNWFDTGEMKTGLSLFVTTQLPYLTYKYGGEDGTYHFTDNGGVMSKTIADGDSTVVTTSIEFNSWTPVWTDKWSCTLTDGEPVPDWLTIDLADQDDYNHGGVSVATVTAQPLPDGVTWREAVVRFAIPGAWLDYTFSQGTPSQHLTGDVNGDGEVTIADVNAVIDLILGGQYDPDADVNGDGEVTIADVNAVIDIILKGGAS